jgi:hypothetical protein
VIEDTSWTEHLRRFERTTAADVALRERKLAFHIGTEPPRVRRALRESTVRGERAKDRACSRPEPRSARARAHKPGNQVESGCSPRTESAGSS